MRFILDTKANEKHYIIYTINENGVKKEMAKVSRKTNIATLRMFYKELEVE